MSSTLDIDLVLELAEENAFGLGTWGICKACGQEQEGCEPDVRNGQCVFCEKMEVFGVDELLMNFDFSSPV